MGIINVGLGKMCLITDTRLSIQTFTAPAFPYRMGSFKGKRVYLEEKTYY